MNLRDNWKYLQFFQKFNLKNRKFQLLELKICLRLKNFEQISSHDYFSSTNWANIAEKKVFLDWNQRKIKVNPETLFSDIDIQSGEIEWAVLIVFTRLLMLRWSNHSLMNHILFLEITILSQLFISFLPHRCLIIIIIS